MRNIKEACPSLVLSLSFLAAKDLRVEMDVMHRFQSLLHLLSLSLISNL